MAQAQTARAKVVTILGDSLTTGYGLPASKALPAQLQAELRRMGINVTVRAAGVSGATTAGGLASVSASVRSDTDLCLIALGGNDLLRGVAPRVIQANLSAIVSKLKTRGIRAMLLGVRAPGAFSMAYTREFNAVAPAVAKAAGVRAYPDLLGQVAMNRALNQGDGLHPNADGVREIVRRLAPVVATELRK